MGYIVNGVEFAGTVGPYTAYRRKGSDKTFLRARRQSSGKKLKQLLPRVQENIHEFVLSSYAAGAIRQSIQNIRHLADHNFTPRLTSLARKVQKLDPVSARGQRNVLISQHPSYFAGFNLNKNNPFDSIIRHPLQCTIDAEAGRAVVELPALLQGVSLFLPWPVPQYRVIMSLSMVADQLYNAEMKKEWFNPFPATATTGWLNAVQGYEGKSFELVLPVPEKKPEVARVSYVLSVGVEWEFASWGKRDGLVKVGAGKIVGMEEAVINKGTGSPIVLEDFPALGGA